MGTVQAQEAEVDRNIRRVASLLCLYREIAHRDLAKLMGISQPGMSARMNGKQAFRTVEVAQLAEIFEVPVAIFFEGPEALLSSSVGGVSTKLDPTIPGLTCVPLPARAARADRDSPFETSPLHVSAYRRIIQ
jgi:transcriptional regulator with XRE-family HTH domain